MTVHLVMRDLCGVDTVCWWGQSRPPRGVNQLYGALLKPAFQSRLSGRTIRKLQSPQRSPILFKPSEEIMQGALPGVWCVSATETTSTRYPQLAWASLGRLAIPQWGALARQRLTHSLKPAERLLVLLNPPCGAGAFHLWFPNCPHSGKSWTFCNSFIWLLFGIIYPHWVNDRSAPMFSISPLTYLVSTLTYLLFLAEQFLFESKSEHLGNKLQKMPERNVMRIHVVMLPCNTKHNSLNMQIPSNAGNHLLPKAHNSAGQTRT